MSVDATPGGVTSDSYVSNSSADTYWANRNEATWSSASSLDQDAGLREATQYLDGKYDWIGYIATTTQTLGWPRTSAYDKEGRELLLIPNKLEDACCELALQSLSNRLVPVGTVTGKDSKKEKVGEIEVEYFEGKSTVGEYDFVDMIISDLTINSGATINIARS